MMDPPLPTDKPTRLPLSTSAQEFGFGHTCSAPPSPSLMTFDFDEPFPSTSPTQSHSPNESASTPPLLRKFARNNLLTIRTGSLTDLTSRTHSPLRISFSRKSISGLREKINMQDESDSERERDRLLDHKRPMRNRSGSSPSSVSAGSELPTPPMPLDAEREPSTSSLPTQLPPSVPFRPSESTTTAEEEEIASRRLSHSLKPPRLLSLMAESNPAENELQSEAQFQRLLAAYNGLPIGRPKSSRSASNRGRYPEEAIDDYDDQREDSPSEDDEVVSNTAVGSITSANLPIAASGSGVMLDDAPMPEEFRDSPSGSINGMDVDMPLLPAFASNSSSSVSNMSPVPWRQTPPPSASAIRPNKRKRTSFSAPTRQLDEPIPTDDDRFDPYPNSAKRRAVSPSITALRESLSYAMGASGNQTGSPASIPIPRSPIVRSRETTHSAMTMSVASSPGTYTYPYPHSHSHSHPHSLATGPMPLGFMSMSVSASLSRPLSALNSPLSSSPQQRPVTLLASPILRPTPRMASASSGSERERDRGMREIDGTGQAVSSLSLS